MSNTANLSDIASNAGPAPAAAGGTASLSDITSNAGPVTSPAKSQPPFMAATPKASYLPTSDDMKSMAENPVGTTLSLPLIKMLLPVYDVLDKATSLTAAGRQEHPILSEIGSLADNIHELLTGGVSAGKPMGTKYGVANNPVTQMMAAAPAAAETAPQVASDIVEMQNPFRNLASKFTGSNIQPTLKTGIQDVWNTVADEAGVARPTTKSVQDLGQEIGDAVLARSKAAYKAIDTATEGRFSGTEQALKAVNQDLRSVTNDTEENALQVRKTRLEMQLDNMMDDAEAKGVSKSTVDAAKADFKKAQSIFDTNHQIRMSTTGIRPGMQGAEDVPEEVNAKSLMNRLNKLYNKTDKSGAGRLQTAVGEDNANDLIGHTATAQKAARTAARNVSAAKTAAKAVGTGAIYEGAKHLLE